jgi:hypothetical protein
VPLSTIVAIQFVPLLAISAIIATFTWRRTGSSLPGALICGIFVTRYVAAGTATQAAFQSVFERKPAPDAIRGGYRFA